MGPNLLILGHLARGDAKEISTVATWEFTVYLQWELEKEQARANVEPTWSGRAPAKSFQGFKLYIDERSLVTREDPFTPPLRRMPCAGTPL